MQMNQVSHFLDGSTIYGSNVKKSRELRTFEGGHLRVATHNNRPYLPRGGDAELASQCGENCYNSGEHKFRDSVVLVYLSRDVSLTSPCDESR